MIAQSVKALNSNCKVAGSMPTLSITRCYVFGKALYSNTPTRSSAVQWVRAQVGNLKIFDSRFVTGQCTVLSLGETLRL